MTNAPYNNAEGATAKAHPDSETLPVNAWAVKEMLGKAALCALLGLGWLCAGAAWAVALDAALAGAR